MVTIYNKYNTYLKSVYLYNYSYYDNFDLWPKYILYIVRTYVMFKEIIIFTYVYSLNKKYTVVLSMSFKM